MATVTGFTAARTQEIEDKTVVSGLVDVNGHLLLEQNDGTQIDAGQVKGDDGADALYPIGIVPNGVAKYKRLALLNGIDASTGASLQFMISGLGSVGVAHRGTALIHVVQRGLGVVNVRGWTWGFDGSVTPLTLYTRQLTDYQFEVWGLFAPYAWDANMMVLSKWNTDIVLDNTVEVAPISLVAATLTRGDMAPDIVANSLRLPNGNDLSLTSTNHAFQIGADTGLNIAMDNNEFMARNNGVASNMGFQAEGGNMSFGNSTSVITAHGIMLKPNLPAFQAKGASTVAKSGTTTISLLDYSTVIFNQGNAYNSATSRFTAPIAGLYQFSFSAVQATAVSGPELDLYKNGVEFYSNPAIGYTQYTPFGTTVLVDMAVGDYVQIYWANNNNTAVTIDRTRSYFSGFLIG